LGFGEKCVAWVAISAASPSADRGLFRPAEEAKGEKGGTKSANGPWVPLRFPGVLLKTE